MIDQSSRFVNDEGYNAPSHYNLAFAVKETGSQINNRNE